MNRYPGTLPPDPDTPSGAAASVHTPLRQGVPSVNPGTNPASRQPDADAAWFGSIVIAEQVKHAEQEFGILTHRLTQPAPYARRLAVAVTGTPTGAIEPCSVMLADRDCHRDYVRPTFWLRGWRREAMCGGKRCRS